MASNGAASASVGTILPPPEMRNIVEKTALFIAKNGMEFAERIRQEYEGKPKYNFLNPTSPYYAFFLHRIEEYKAGAQPPAAVQDKDKATKPSQNDVLPKVELRGPPPDPQFLYEPPTLFQQDVDIVRLTAQFVARSGRDFLTKLMQQEANNYQFEFLKPHHVLFPFFQRMIEQYSKVLIPTPEMKARLQADAQDSFHSLERVTYSVEWTREQQRTQRAEAEEADAERVAFAQIDWHDFVVVQTIDFTPADTDLPPPITIDELGQRLLDMDKGPGAPAPAPIPPPVSTPAPAPVPAAAPPPAAAAASDAMDVEMEVDEPAPARTAAPRLPVASDIKIRKDYDPKAVHRSGPSEPMQVSPLTGELIPASKFDEHLRISLLDPRWREQKEKEEAERAKSRESHALGMISAMQTLKELASHRTDVFVSDTGPRPEASEEQQMSSAARIAALGAGPQPVVPKPVVPGGPPPNIRAAAPGAVPLPAPPAAVRPPAPVAAPAAPAAPPVPLRMPAPLQVAPPSAAPPPLATAPAPAPAPAPPAPAPAPVVNAAPPPSAAAANSAPAAPAAPVPGPGLPPGIRPMGMGMGMRPMLPPGVTLPMGMGGMMGMGMGGMNMGPMGPMGMGMGGPGGMGMGGPGAGAPMFNAAPVIEPPAKRTKADALTDRLEPEDVFLRTHQGLVTLSIAVGEADSKWRVSSGQVVAVSVAYTDKISDLKQRVQDQFGIPINKQKLQLEDLVLSNTNSVAFYNLTPASPLSLGSKTRGGRK